LLGLLLTAAAGCATVTQFPPIEIVDSRAMAGNPSLAGFFVTVHVILQVHEQPHEQYRGLQDKAQVAACQDQVVATALDLAQKGIRTVVVEGLQAGGTLDNPEPTRIDEIPKTEIASAKWILANRSELAVYGFEVKPLNDFDLSVVSRLGESAARARELGKQGYDAMSTENKDEYRRLVQDEVTRLNLWYAGVIPERSFLALQTALSVALARRENHIQLVIGKQHWSDLVYAANRQEDVRIRLIPYLCEQQ
jgi:hypothetical protein